MQTRTWRNRGVACVLVLAWHLLVGWWLLHALPGMHQGNDDDILRVVDVIVPVPSPPPPPPLRLRDVPAAEHPTGDTTLSTRPWGPVATVVDDRPSIAPSPLPSLVDQARNLVRRNAAAATTFANDPLADRPSRLPAADAGRFRMRVAATPASALAWIGRHMTAPPGYEQDACPRNQRNIAGLLAQGDSSRLQMELEFERRHCRS